MVGTTANSAKCPRFSYSSLIFFCIFRYKFLAKGFQILKRTYDMKYKDQNKKACMLGEVGIMQGKEKNKTNHLSLASSEKREELFQEEKYRYKFFLKLTLYKSRRFGKQNVMRKLTETKEMEIADKKEKILENMSRNFFYICIRHNPKC